MKKIFFIFLNLILIWNLSGQQLWPPEEEIIGNTYDDLQTWRAMQNRMYYFDDGTIGAVWNLGFNYPGFNDHGIGYNYFDGNSWGMYPWESITSGWANFPSYTDYGENGEICVSQGQNGIYINWRENKGNGVWQESFFSGTNLKHPLVITSGNNNTIVHLLYLIADSGFNPTPAQPCRGFIWYARSSDGMQTWDINQEIDGLGPDEYLGFTIGAYTWAEPKNDVLAFVAGDYLTDLLLMKSTDEGDTWQKTVVWEHPYPMFEIFSFNSDTFYCNDGGITVALDNESTVHVAFGISRVYSSTSQDTIWYCPEVGAIVYWQEDMPSFSSNVNALNPYDHPDSELIKDYNLIGWIQDIDGNGQIDTLYDVSVYPTPGLLIMPQIVISEFNEIYVIFNSITEIFNNGTMDYRHLWVRASPDKGISWGWFFDLNSDLIHIFDECVYPSAFSFIKDDKLNYIFCHDNEPGIVPGGQLVYTENFINYSSVPASPLTIYVTADFFSSATLINEGDSIEFLNQSSGNPEPNQFHWIFEGGTPNNSNVENPTIIYNEAGVYDVTLHVYNDSVEQTLKKENYITVLPGTGINKNLDKKEILVSPNPTNGKISVLLPDNGEISIKIINLLGQVVLENQIEPVQRKINLELTGNPEGIYFVEIKSGEQECIKKVILRK